MVFKNTPINLNERLFVMKNQIGIIFLLLLNISTAAQSIDYIKFAGNNGENGFKILINKNYKVILNPYLVSNVLAGNDSIYDSKTGMNLKLIGCNKDSLFFENGIGIPLAVIKSLDNIKQRTILYSNLLAINLSIIGIVNYNTFTKYHQYPMIILPNIPFVIIGTVLLIGMPNEKNKIYLNKHHIKEYRYYDVNTNKINSFGVYNPKNIFDKGLN